MDNYDLSYEKRFLDLLGYEYVENTPGKWKILDENKKEVGYIEASLNDSSDNERSKYTYHMVINSDTIDYDYERDFDNLIYTFNVKDIGDVMLRLGKYTFCVGDSSVLTISGDNDTYIDVSHGIGSSEYGIINSGVNGINLSYRYPINGYIVDEGIGFRNKDYFDNNLFKVYQYDLHYHKANDEDEDRHGYSISAHSIYDNPQKLWSSKITFLTMPKNEQQDEEEIVIGNNKIKLFIKTIKRVFKGKSKNNDNHRPLRIDSYPTNARTVEEFAIEHGRGIELFKQTCKLINQIMPFKKDIIYEIFKDYIDEYGFSILFDGDEKEKAR